MGILGKIAFSIWNVLNTTVNSKNIHEDYIYNRIQTDPTERIF